MIMIEFFGLVRFVVLSVLTLLAYVLSSVSLYKIGVNNNVKYPWLAFVPIAHYYIIGSICEEYRLMGVTIKQLGIVMPLLLLAQVSLSAVLSFLAFVPGIIIGIVVALIMHKFFYLFDPTKAFILAIICLFGHLATALTLFYIKDMLIQMSSGAYPYPFGESR